MVWLLAQAYTRVALHAARTRTWPTTPFGMLNLGMVAGLDDPY